MKKFTLDTNCIIDLEDNRPDAIYLQNLIEVWKEKKIELAVVAVSASENQKDGTWNTNFSSFEKKLENVDLSGVHHLLPFKIWDVHYWDHAIWGDEEMSNFAFQIKKILFPNMAEKPPEDLKGKKEFRNRLCDVLVGWSHAYHNWEYLVTRDSNFHYHKIELKEIGVKEIIHPKEIEFLY